MEEKPAVKVVELDLDEVKKVREQLPLLKHRRGDIYALTTFFVVISMPIWYCIRQAGNPVSIYRKKVKLWLS